MVDGYDVWMQLRPQTLIDRYFEINRRADQRTNLRLGNYGSRARQEIVFGCQKKCWPWEAHDTPCYAVPHSDLPLDIYGPDTDKMIEGLEEPNPWRNIRPRFLNSGYAIGTVRAMRKLFDQARKNLEHEKNFGSDQFIFSHIYGDQEVWREALRLDGLSDSEKEVEDLVDGLMEPAIKFNPDHIEAVRKKAADTEDGTFEFAIGMDFRSEIGINTVFNEDETAWLVWDNKTQKLEEERRVGIKPPVSSKLDQLPEDIASTPPPFWTLKQGKSPKWSEVPLFTDIITGSIPAVIHHNAHRDGRKALREQWWDRTWYFERLRALYDSSIHEPVGPLAYSGYSEESRRAWWTSDSRKGGARSGPMLDSNEGDQSWLSFEQICAEHHEEVFRDGQGR